MKGMTAFKTGMLMVALTALLLFVGKGLDIALHTNYLMMVFFSISIIMNLVSYWFSDKIALGMFGAKPVAPAELQWLHEMLGRLAYNAKIPKPKLYLVPTDTPNAFATGRSPSNAAVAVTSGILKALSQDELEGVIAHELSHIKNRDTLISCIVACVAGLIMMLANLAKWAAIFGGGRSDNDNDNGGIFGLLFLVIVAPIAAMLIQMAISRQREYAADAMGAQISRKPMSLAKALINIENIAKQIPLQASPATSHMFIINPLKGGGIMSLFSTHPSTKDRVSKLQELAREMRCFS